MTDTAAILFWVSTVILLYAFFAYSVLLWIFSRVLINPVEKQSIPGKVSVVLVVYNEAGRIEQRLHNLVDALATCEEFELVITSDGSTDATIEKIRNFAHPKIKLIDRAVRNGKAACINIGIAAASNSVVILADARQRFTTDTIEHLVANFADSKVGAVSGALEIEPSSGGVASAVDAYWRIEKTIRCNESKIDSCIGCTGAVYAIRREAFSPIPEDTILDDVVLPMMIALKGYRIIFESKAVAYDPQQLAPQLENIRKRRTLAGNFQMLFRYPTWLFPWRNRLWWQLISHKYLRLAGPFLLVLAFISSSCLAGNTVYRTLLAAQCLIYFLALVGILLPHLKMRLVAWPAGFVFLNWMTLHGFVDWMLQPRQAGWQTPRQS